MKVYLDENLSAEIARILQQNGVDAVSAHDVGNVQLDDHAQLAYTTEDGRAIVTANVVDFLVLATSNEGRDDSQRATHVRGLPVSAARVSADPAECAGWSVITQGARPRGLHSANPATSKSWSTRTLTR